MHELENRVALVTGAGTGIGKATAQAFANAGVHGVVLAGRREAELDGTADLVRAAGSIPLVISTDVSNESAVSGLISAAVDEFGRLDACFNNAGNLGNFRPIWEQSEDDFDATMSVNLKGAWLCCKHQMAAMIRLGNGGAIVNTSSWLAHGAFPGSSVYSASKSALDGMIRALAQEAAVEGIRVNNVNPGIIDTPMFRIAAEGEADRQFIRHTPAQRLGTPEDIADAVVWLCSDGARFVTGQNLLVDGGYTIPGHRAWATDAIAS
ncbi:glucose 1-dehydrogenase [Mesorhizobium sp. SB112]|uniref:SDR family NAD(P)-dependent oxidoreductase n=1 Tax=Mesorhizobium sp. SB112 TaxID=3151853 RepID=UPI0032668370